MLELLPFFRDLRKGRRFFGSWIEIWEFPVRTSTLYVERPFANFFDLFARLMCFEDSILEYTNENPLLLVIPSTCQCVILLASNDVNIWLLHLKISILDSNHRITFLTHRLFCTNTSSECDQNNYSIAFRLLSEDNRKSMLHLICLFRMNRLLSPFGELCWSLETIVHLLLAFIL